MNQAIEPEFKHEVRADIEVRNKIHQRNTNLVANVFADIEVPPNFARNPVIHKAAVNQGQRPEGLEAVRPNQEDQLISKGKAVYNKCIQILNKMGFPEEQGQQLCQLLTETMIIADQEQKESNSQQNQQGNPAGNSTQQGPPPSGFIGSNATNCAKTAALNKELEILRVKQEKLDIELAKERQAFQKTPRF